jgi:hypothetical protein
MIDDREEVLTRALEGLAGDPAPPCRVDIGAVVTEGRRGRRRRRTVGAATAAVLLAVGTAALALPTRQVQPPDSRIHQAGLDPRDPLAVDARFGWLPPSMHSLVSVDSFRPSGVTDPQLRVTTTDPRSPESGSGLNLIVFPQGQDPRSSPDPYLPGTLSTTSAPKVDGRRAYWLAAVPQAPQPPLALLALRWQSADGRWVDLIAEGSALTKSDLLHVASQTTLAGQSLPMPFYLAHSSGTQVQQESEAQSLAGQASAQGPVFTLSLSLSGGGYVYYLTVSPHIGGPPLALPQLPAEAQRNLRPSRLCETERGLDLCVMAFGPDSTSHLRGVLDHVQPLGTDPDNWTTDVLR